MGTFGTNLLGSDSAQDFIDSVATMSADQRLDEVSRVLTLAVNEPSSIMDEVVPEEVVAAAVLVAATLPGADDGLGVNEEARRASLPDRAPRILVRLAVQAIDVTTGPDSWWRTSWTQETDAELAMDAIRQLRAVLLASSE